MRKMFSHILIVNIYGKELNRSVMALANFKVHRDDELNIYYYENLTERGVYTWNCDGSTTEKSK